MLRGIARVGPRLAFSLSIGERDAIPGLPPPSTEIADLPSTTLWDVPAELRATPATIARHAARRPAIRYTPGPTVATFAAPRPARPIPDRACLAATRAAVRSPLARSVSSRAASSSRRLAKYALRWYVGTCRECTTILLALARIE